MKKSLLLSLIIVLFSTLSFAQSDKFWTPNQENASKITTDKAVKRLSFPKEFKLFDLNIAPLKQELFTIVGTNASKHSTIISLPNLKGTLESFEVFEASNFEPALQAQFPEIRAFSGRGITDKYASLKLSISPQGIQTMIFREETAEFIEPYSQNHTTYAVFTSNRDKGKLPWTCTTEDHGMMNDANTQIQNTSKPTFNDGKLRTMRLAQSCNAEYANFFGATSTAQVGLVLAAYNTTLTRCNGCYEKDLALHLNLIANTADVIYYIPSTDPYTAWNVGNGIDDWNDQLQNTLNAIIGASNYDIGHLFGANGGGGNAGCIGCICSDANKGSGITSPSDGIPQGDNFDIDYVVHEVGHQLGGTHTFSKSNENTGTNKEVGSGITIMGYAGITSQDVAPHSIAFYHQTSINQIQNNLQTKTCPISTVITPVNATPVVAPVANRVIPLSTPFILTGTATDANAGDALTYQWEQNDNSPNTLTGNNSVAFPAKASGPNWLSFSPTASGARTCPKLSTVLAGLFVTPTQGGDAVANVEALSSVGRNLNFRLTVRDNSPYISSGAVSVGQTAFTDMTVTVDPTSGPFMVTVPNTNVSWFTSSTQTVTWSVNNTTAAPVSCANVNILISTDGGFNFTMLLANTPNDGSEVVTMPSTATTTARIKVESVGNIFFDISNTNFTLAPPPTDFTFGTTVATTSACPAPATMAVTQSVGAIGGFANPVTLSATAGVPAGTTISFGTNPVAPGASSVITLNNANTLVAGTYVVTISGSATGGVTKTTTITYIISAGTAPVITTPPASAAACVGSAAPTFNVATSTAGVSYQWQMATAATPTVFSNIALATTASYTPTGFTAAMNGNVYHCNLTTQCGFAVSANAILTVNSPAAISAAGQPANFPACTGLTATFNSTASGTGVTYQWQSATALGGPYTSIAGATTSNYTTSAITGTTPTFYQVVATTTVCPATVTSTVAQLTISTTTAIGTQPSSQTVCVPAPAILTATATGTGVAGGALTYQWQVATAAAPTVFTNIPVATSATYNTGATTAAMNGNIYHLVVTGACNTATTNNVTLTANTAAALGTILPTAQTVCNGVAATFTGSATGTGVTYQWQFSSTGIAGTYSNVVGATTATYTTVPTIPSMNGYYYRLLATTNTCAGTVNTAPVLLTVNTVAVIGTNNAPTVSACIPQTASFNVTATGTGLTYQWQVAAAGTTTFVDIPGATSATYTTIASTLAMNGSKYRVNILSTCSPTTPTTSNETVLTVNNPVTISAQPTVQSGCSNDNYTFSVTAVSPGNTITYAWEVSASATGPFTLVANGTIYGGVTTNTLTITNAPLFLNGNYYRVFISVPCGAGVSSSYSNAAQFNISAKPTVVLTKPQVSNTNAAVNTIITTTVSPYSVGQTATYTWKKNGTILPNTLASTSIVVPVDDAGSYQVSIADAATGCIALSNIIVTDANTSDNLLTGRVFIYPNPVSSRMIVRYNNSDASNRATSIAVYDEKGALVINKAFSIVGTNGRMEIDMSRLALGTYIVYVVDASGKKLAAGKAIKVQ